LSIIHYQLLILNNISKKFPDFGLNGISFGVGRGDYFILLGESGAGKSMVLETIAGLLTPDGGTVHLEGRDITQEKIQHRGVGLVFQDHAVFPHLSVRENIRYALHGSQLTNTEREEQVQSIAARLSITELLDRRPSTLSGGELQRVALARTLIQKPVILLLDEPLASLDTRLKAELRALLRQIHREGQTILHVTHDYEEALSLGTKVAVIHNGQIIQQGPPNEVFHSPKSEFVARFVGIRNYFAANLKKVDGYTTAILHNNLAIRIVTNEPEGEGFVLIRGEDILLSPGPVESSATNNFEGSIVEIVPSVNGMEVTLDAGVELHALVTPESVINLKMEEGKPLWAHVKATAVKYIGK
jgi:molybdate transport system ATP-binding protein/molybdate/tungstate transport system ATP-binding protein